MKKNNKKRTPPKCTVFVQARKTSTPFTKSLRSLKPEEIPLRRGSVSRKSTSNIVLSAFRYAALTLSSLVFVASLSALIAYGADYVKTSNEHKLYQDIFNGQNTDLVSVDRSSYENVNTLSIQRSLDGEIILTPNISVSQNKELEEMRSQILALKRMNSDVWGWIRVDGTQIDFPIMFSGDNEYYLTRTPSKAYSKNGSIFADGRTQPSLEDNRNLVLYGHNISTTGIMFSELIDFTREDIFNTRGLTIYTLDGIYRYEMFSVYATHSDYNYIRTKFGSDSQFIAFANKCDQMSNYHKGFDFTGDDRLLTLSTCTNMRDNRRWAMHCKLMSVTK